MELKVTHCKDCPLYVFREVRGKNWWEWASFCNHPLSKKEHIDRAYDKIEESVVPLTPLNCPLNKSSITIIKKT